MHGLTWRQLREIEKKRASRADLIDWTIAAVAFAAVLACFIWS